MSDTIAPEDVRRLAANESIILATLKWAAANGRRLTRADLERMGQGVDAMVEENERLTKERDEARAERDEAAKVVEKALSELGQVASSRCALIDRIQQLESEWSGWPALQREWFGDRYAAMQPWDAVRARIEDSEARMKRLEAWGDALDDLVPEPPDRNCSCHINPPCSDCVDHSEVREVKQGWKEAKEAKP